MNVGGTPQPTYPYKVPKGAILPRGLGSLSQDRWVGDLHGLGELGVSCFLYSTEQTCNQVLTTVPGTGLEAVRDVGENDTSKVMAYTWGFVPYTWGKHLRNTEGSGTKMN